ncbi:MAG: type II toxin-antitoxin system CcdA family antitoxin [Acidimicrobiales bacterium]
MRRINVTVPGELLARARAAGLNLSEVTRTALAQRLALSVVDGSTELPSNRQSPLPSTGASSCDVHCVPHRRIR